MENIELKKNMNHLLEQVKTLNSEAKAAKDTISILEHKVSKSEAAALKVFEERSLETVNMRNVLKKKDSEILSCKKDLVQANKDLKAKEKEAFKLEQKNDNQADNIKRFKTEISTLKVENKKLVKKKPQNKLKSVNVSTNTLPVTFCNPIPLSSTSKSTSNSTPRDISMATIPMPLISPHSTTIVNNNGLPKLVTASSEYPCILPSISPNSSPLITMNNNVWPLCSSFSDDQHPLSSLNWPPLVAISPKSDSHTHSINPDSNKATTLSTPVALALHTDMDEVFRKEAKKWDSFWADHNKKTDEMFNKILTRLEAEENEQHSSN